MPAALRRPSVAGVVGALVVLWGLVIGLQPLSDNSFLTHLATGRLIVQEGIPRHDPFSFTAAGQPWTVQSWLAAAAFAVAEKVGGGHGIVVLRAALTAVLAAMAWRLARPAGALAGRLLAVTPVLAIGTVFWRERPLLVALVLLAGVVMLAEDDRGPVWLLLPLMWLWVNVHGSFPLGVLYLLTRLLGARIDRRPLERHLRLVGAALAGCLLGALNPLGPRLLLFPLRVLTDNEAFAQITEWRSPDFTRPYNLAFLALVLGAAVLVLRRPSWEDALVVAAFGALGCIALRNTVVASVVVLPVLARGLGGLGSERGEGRNLVTTVAMGVVVAVGAVAVVSSLRRPAYDLTTYPMAELTWMEGNGLLDGRLAAPDVVGNLLTARAGRRVPVFIDDRYDMYPAPVRRDYVVLHNGGEGWQEVLDRHRVSAVLWPRSRPLSGLLALDPGWRLVLREEGWVVAVRVGAG